MNAVQKPLTAPSQCYWIKREASSLKEGRCDVCLWEKKIRELDRDVSVSKIGMRNKSFISMSD